MNGLRRNYIKSSHIYYITPLPLDIYNSNRVSDFLNSALCIMNYAFNAKQKFIAQKSHADLLMCSLSSRQTK